MVLGSKVTIEISPMACIYAAIIVLAVPLRWSMAWIASALCHELFHCIALILCGKFIECISVDICGAEIYSEVLTSKETVVCALAGPLGGVFLILSCSKFPELVLCALLQTAVNLLPIFPLDGGRALLGLVNMIFPDRWTKTIIRSAETITLSALFLLSFSAAFIFKIGIVSLMPVTFLVIKSHNRKIPCKWGALKVQ